MDKLGILANFGLIGHVWKVSVDPGNDLTYVFKCF